MCIKQAAKQYLHLNAQKKAIEDAMKELRPILEAEMNRLQQDKTTIITDDGLPIRISYTLQARKDIDKKALQEMHPAIYSQFERENVFPVLRVMA